MRKILLRTITLLGVLASLQANAAPSELQSYVQQCQNELHFNASDVPALNCNKGYRFAFGGQNPTNDFFIYQRVNDTVDLVTACRWLNDTQPDGTDAYSASVELIINNRQNGETCFFSAKDVGTSDPIRPVSTAIVSPTNFGNVHPNADDFWLQPTDLNNKQLPSEYPDGTTGFDFERCVGCHSQGPYIASEDIVPFLTQFGLLNNGHPTFIDMTAPQHYHAVGSSAYNNPTDPTNHSAFKTWDSIVFHNDVQTDCSSACHSLANNSTIGILSPVADPGNRLLPSIQSDIFELQFDGFMPPYYDELNDYRWINLDTPTNSTPSNGVETENFADAMSSTAKAVPNLALAAPPPTYSCPNLAVPMAMEAHAVGVPNGYAFSTNTMSLIPNRLRTFNLKDGLVCINSDQEPGQQCHDYAVRYLCSVNNTDGTPAWSVWYNHSPVSDGDHEERSKDTNPTLCANPLAIQTEVILNGVPTDVMGPNDRLARFSQYGLTCNNSDQPDGQCSNYAVRYHNCIAPPFQYLARITAAWSNTELTATGTANNASAKGQPYTPSWNTQQWMIEPVANTEYVRIRNTGTNTYLNVTTQSEAATVVTYAFTAGYTSEEWIIEGVPQSDLVRFKNLWSGKYLTLGDASNYSAIYSQGLNTTWASQKWSIN